MMLVLLLFMHLSIILLQFHSIQSMRAHLDKIAQPYICELIKKKESHVKSGLVTDHQLIMSSISKECLNNFPKRSFIYTAPCEWNKLRDHIRTSNLIVYTTIWMLTVNKKICIVHIIHRFYTQS